MFPPRSVGVIAGALANASVSPVSPVPSHVGDELRAMEQRAAALHSVIDELGTRLECVMTPIPPQSNAGDSAGPTGPPISTVVHALRIGGFQTDAAIVRLQELVRRLEL